MRFDIDMTFSVQSPGDGKSQPEQTNGTIKAAGRTITVTADSLSDFPSARTIDRSGLNEFAQKLKEAGITLVVDGPDGNLVNLGNVKSNLISRIGTSSSAVRVGKLSASRKLLSRKSGAGMGESVAIPGTMFPLVPTVLRNYRRRPTTTHYTRGSGAPRLIYVKDSESWNGKAPKVFAIPDEGLDIGSAESPGLVLPGLDPIHAKVVHNELDEYVLVAVGRVGGSAGLKPGSEYTLRSGARVELGDWRILFYREEYADHGRPYGGRNGGELSFQKPQYNMHTGRVERDSSV
ncbi:FHA domain-containing protein [Paeniglutamicibacter antarcticus]|uniref:FHA domain-containing protein n=1 Tax=Paeniglutamicibacter antarcticus TaxID=494023 RepID=A0ABP9TM71_9MICC